MAVGQVLVARSLRSLSLMAQHRPRDALRSGHIVGELERNGLRLEQAITELERTLG